MLSFHSPSSPQPTPDWENCWLQGVFVFFFFSFLPHFPHALFCVGEREGKGRVKKFGEHNGGDVGPRIITSPTRCLMIPHSTWSFLFAYKCTSVPLTPDMCQGTEF
jgi:hypothetical protein